MTDQERDLDRWCAGSDYDHDRTNTPCRSHGWARPAGHLDSEWFWHTRAPRSATLLASPSAYAVSVRNDEPITVGWADAPDGQVLMPGRCGARDADGEACASFDHYPKPHQRTGLRTWLESTMETVIIRCYEADRAGELEAMEAPLFEAFGFRPVARQDVARTAGLHVGWTLVVGPLLAPSATVHLRVVCYARQSQ